MIVIGYKLPAAISLSGVPRKVEGITWIYCTTGGSDEDKDIYQLYYEVPTRRNAAVRKP